MKKPQLAKLAESDLVTSGWLPEPLRIEGNVQPDHNEAQ